MKNTTWSSLLGGLNKLIKTFFSENDSLTNAQKTTVHNESTKSILQRVDIDSDCHNNMSLMQLLLSWWSVQGVTSNMALGIIGELEMLAIDYSIYPTTLD